MLKFEEINSEKLNNGWHMAAGVAVGAGIIFVAAT